MKYVRHIPFAPCNNRKENYFQKQEISSAHGYYFPSFTDIHTILQNLLNFKLFLAKIRFFVDYDGQLCKHFYVNLVYFSKNFFIIFNYFSIFRGLGLPKPTKYCFCKFSFMFLIPIHYDRNKVLFLYILTSRYFKISMYRVAHIPFFGKHCHSCATCHGQQSHPYPAVLSIK